MALNKYQNIDQIIKACRSGDQQAFKNLYESYKASLFSICLRYSNFRNEAEDYLQESFILIFRNIDKFDSTKGAFYTWSSKIVVNTILMSKRKNNIKFDDIEQVVPIDVAFDENILGQLEYKDLVKSIQKLPSGFQTVLNLYVIEGYKHHEIAELLGISENTSKTQLMRAKLALKKILLDSEEVIYEQKLLKSIG